MISKKVTSDLGLCQEHLLQVSQGYSQNYSLLSVDYCLNLTDANNLFKRPRFNEVRQSDDNRV
jgi:hypothetical protein